MIFRFADNKGLTIAYTELLDIGIPESCIVPYFEEYLATPQPMASHQSFLQHLRSWFVAGSFDQKHRDDPEQKIEPPVSPIFRKCGGTLTIESVGRETEVIAIAIHHYGEMVG